MTTRSTAGDGRGRARAPAAPADDRQRRADAARNRVALLDSARRVLSARGLDVPVEEIAREAGVGVGTVYRNFPTKEALLDAVIARAFEDLSADAESELDGADPGEAFFDFLRRAAAVMARDRVLVWSARAHELAGRSRAPVVERLFAATDALLERAIGAGAVRPGIRAEDISALLVGVGDAANERGRPTPDGFERYVAVLVDGLRARRSSG